MNLYAFCENSKHKPFCQKLCLGRTVLFALLCGVALDWLAYKHERDEAYTPTGLQSLLEQIEKQVADHSEQAVADVIRLSMSNGGRGIVWDKIRKEEARGQNTTAGTEDAHKLSGIIRL